MAYEKMYRLIDKLIEKNQNGDFNWEKTSQDNVFQVSLGGSSMRIEKSYSDRGDLFVLRLYDKDGVLVEETNDEDLDSDKGSFGYAINQYYILMRDLYESARRRGMGVEKVIDNILQELEGSDNIF